MGIALPRRDGIREVGESAVGVANACEITIDSGPVTVQAGAFTIRSSIGVRNWSTRTPSAAAVRPTHCPGCHLGAHPVGERVRLIGHGLRSRRVRTALEPDAPVTVVTVFVRRFLCRDCGAAIQVVPAEILPRARYSATAMARALGMVGFGGRSFAEARQVVGDGQSRDWPALRRWHRPLGGLGPRSPFRAAGSPRERAQRVTARLLAYTPPGDAHGDMGRRAEIGASWLCGAPWIPRTHAPTSKDQVAAIAALLDEGLRPPRRQRGGHRPSGRTGRARRRLDDQRALVAAVRRLPLLPPQDPDQEEQAHQRRARHLSRYAMAIASMSGTCHVAMAIICRDRMAII